MSLLRKTTYLLSITLILSLLFVFPVLAEKQYIYDDADVLSDAEEEELTQLAADYSKQHEVDFIIVTADELDGRDVVQYTEDFYDEQAPGYDKEHGNTAMMTLDFSDPNDREVYLAGFYKGEKYLSDKRLDQIREHITPDLSADNFAKAGKLFFSKVDQYLGVHPIVNPDGIFLKTWFQLVVALVIGAVIVGSMIFNMGGRVTVNHQTYVDPKHSNVNHRRDSYLRKTVTKTKIQKNKSSGGGGTTSGGHSHSGSRGGF